MQQLMNPPHNPARPPGPVFCLCSAYKAIPKPPASAKLWNPSLTSATELMDVPKMTSLHILIE
jgi:hypothetical protein